MNLHNKGAYRPLITFTAYAFFSYFSFLFPAFSHDRNPNQQQSCCSACSIPHPESCPVSRYNAVRSRRTCHFYLNILTIFLIADFLPCSINEAEYGSDLTIRIQKSHTGYNIIGQAASLYTNFLHSGFRFLIHFLFRLLCRIFRD